MKTLQIDEATARKIYPTAAAELKSILEETFTKDFFKQKITDVIKSFEDALSYKGADSSDVYSTSDTAIQVADKKVNFIAKVLKGDWKCNWADKNQKKWFCVFVWDAQKSAFVFAYSSYYWTTSNSDVGSRLSFPDQETAQYFGTQFIDLINITLKED